MGQVSKKTNKETRQMCVDRNYRRVYSVGEVYSISCMAVVV